MMFQIILLSLLLALVSAQTAWQDRNPHGGTHKCYPCSCNGNGFVTRPNAEIFVSGASIGRISCQDIENTVDVMNPSECSHIQQQTWNTATDPCGCVDANTGESCGAPPVAEVQGCEICGGPDMKIGDPSRYIDDNSNWFDGVTCAGIAEVQLDFSNDNICDMAKQAATDFCKCIPVGESLGNDVCIPQADPNLPGVNSCDPNDDSETCCIGECRFRSTHGTHVCTTKAEQTPPSGYQYEADEEEPVTGISFQAPGGGSCSSVGGSSCSVDDDCCGSMFCMEGYNKCSPASGGGMGGMESARGGGGAGGGRKLARKNKKSSHNHHHRRASSATLKKEKNLRQMKN